jgi:colicin import membrane protein
MINHQLQYHADEERFKRYLKIAGGAHIGVVVIILLLQLIAGINIFDNKMKKEVTMIQSAVRVDVVGMPKYTVQELKKMRVAPAIPEDKGKSEPSKDESKSDVEFKKVGKKVDLSKLLSNLSAKKVRAKTKKKGKTKKDFKKLLAQNKNLRSLVLEGNKVSKGTSVVGDTLQQEQTMFNDYIANLPNIVRPNWKLPTYLLDQELKCRVRVYIAANGKILKTEVFESSGVEEFDRKAIRAVKDSDPLPPPSGDILAKVASGEVILGFPL